MKKIIFLALLLSVVTISKLHATCVLYMSGYITASGDGLVHYTIEKKDPGGNWVAVCSGNLPSEGGPYCCNWSGWDYSAGGQTKITISQDGIAHPFSVQVYCCDMDHQNCDECNPDKNFSI